MNMFSHILGSNVLHVVICDTFGCPNVTNVFKYSSYYIQSVAQKHLQRRSFEAGFIQRYRSNYFHSWKNKLIYLLFIVYANVSGKGGHRGSLLFLLQLFSSAISFMNSQFNLFFLWYCYMIPTGPCNTMSLCIANKTIVDTVDI